MVNSVQRGLQAIAQERDILNTFLAHSNIHDYRNFRYINRHILSVTPALPQLLPPIAPAALHNPRRAASLPSAAASAAPRQAQDAGRRRTSLPSQTDTQALAVHQPNPQPIVPLPDNLQPIAPPMHDGHAAGPLQPHSPLTIPEVLRTYLGQPSCNDLIGPYLGQIIPPGPCPNSIPGSAALVKPCEGTNAATHTPPLGSYLVCSDCHHHNGDNRWVSVAQEVIIRRARLCKKCSKRLNARFNADREGFPRNSCTCADDIYGKWYCYSCMNEEEERILAKGLAESHRLLRTHVVRDEKTKRKSLVLKRVKGAVPGSLQDRPTRKHHACPTRNCGETVWSRTHAEQVTGYGLWGHRESGAMCLCCGGLRVSRYV